MFGMGDGFGVEETAEQRARRPSAAGEAMQAARSRTRGWLRDEIDLRFGKAAADLRAAAKLIRELDERFGTEFETVGRISSMLAEQVEDMRDGVTRRVSEDGDSTRTD